MGGGVAAAAVVGAHRPHLQALLAEQAVDEGGLARPGRAQQSPRGAGPQVLAQFGQALPCHRAHRVDRHAEGNALGLGDRLVEIGAEIGLVEYDHRIGAALPGQGQVALQAAQVELLAEARHQKDRVYVGRHYLGLGGAAHRLPQKGATPRQHGLDGGRPLLGTRLYGHPVSHCRQIVASIGLVAHAPGHLRRELRHVLARRRHETAEHQVFAAQLARHPPGDQRSVTMLERFKGRSKKVVPTKKFEVQRETLHMSHRG